MPSEMSTLIADATGFNRILSFPSEINVIPIVRMAFLELPKYNMPLTICSDMQIECGSVAQGNFTIGDYDWYSAALYLQKPFHNHTRNKYWHFHATVQ